MSGSAYGWFDRAVTAHGGAPALEADGRAFTYQELSAYAGSLAARLTAACGGRRPGRVGLVANRSAAAYAGFLAVLRAGGTVVPLHPEHPVAHNRRITRATGVAVVLTDAAGAGAGHQLAVPEVAADEDTDTHEQQEPVAADPGELAYTISTSGSTGEPKGVPISHRNLDAFTRNAAHRYGVGRGSRVSALFDMAFDASVFDMFRTWPAGGTLVVVPRARLLSPVRTVNDLALTHWFSVPSLITFAVRLGTLTPGAMPGLRSSLFGGEPVPLRLLREWYAATPAGSIGTLYGPTEATAVIADHQLPGDVSQWPDTPGGLAPLGRCYPDVETHLADDGELHVRGPQCITGYLDPARDNGHFLPAGDGGRRWYRTGDRVSRQGGLLVFLGRTDHQVKVRGHRIELGEIEAVLRTLPGVREAAALVLPASDGGPRLAAAVTGAGCEAGSLHAALGERLPAVMRPHLISVLDRLPLNGNGKVDRPALAATLSTADAAHQP
ncbi:AMP-binding protein [Streptomyces sp. NPDC057684]|uniref:AMP-binding protein n=1 Tax=Streptomyces sp. NPDC057684 TaxID=3346211 RepID=UPI0036CF34BB